MSYVLGILGRRRQTSTGARPFAAPPTTYDDIVDAFGSDVVSYWKFQVPSGATVTDERSVANATITGTIERNVPTIVDLDSLSEGAPADGTCIAWSGVIGEYAEIAALNAAHKTSQGTIVVTFQRDATNGERSTLVCWDANGAAGGGSIEVNADGSPRSYLRDANGTVTIIAGVAGTIALNTAYTGIFKWGPGGLSYSIWDPDGLAIWRGTQPSMTDGITGTSAIRFGTYHGDVGHHDGPYGRVVWMSRRIADSEEATIARARTIAHANVPPPATQTLLVPSIAKWLTNDDMALPSSGTKRYVTPNGAGVGGTTEGAAGELHATLAASAAGDTVVCLQGYYDCPNGVTIPAGTNATNPTTLMAKPGSWAVLCKDTSFLNAGLLDAGDGEGSTKTWTLYDSATNTWRMSYGGSSTWPALEGCYFLNGMAHMLFPYPTLTALMSARDSASADGKPQTKNEWWFSGTTVSGGFAYIRFDRPNWNDMVKSGGGTPHNGLVDGTFGAWPDDGRYTVGIEDGGSPTWFSRATAGDFKTGRPTIGQGLNPNDLRIYLAVHNDTRLLSNSSGSYTRFGSGINSFGFRWYNTGRSNHECHRGCHHIPGYVIFPVNNNISNVTFHRTRLFSYGEHRLQGSMSVMKYDEFANPPDQMLQATHRNSFVSANSGSQLIDNITFDNCSIYYFHECVQGNGQISRMRFVNCVFHSIYDEWGQWANSRLNRFEVGYCYFRDSAIFFGGSGEETTTQSPLASEWFHHNIQDNRLPRSSNQDRRPLGGAQSNPRDVSSQAATKHYNNTLIVACDCAVGNANALGWDANTERVTAPTAPAQYDEAFNNIVITSDTKRYDGTEGGVNRKSDFCEQKAMIQASATAFNKAYRDYNLYYRNVPVNPATGALVQKKFHDISGRYYEGKNYDYVRTNTGLEPGNAVFYGSADYDLTVNNIGQTGGWESHASDANPQIPSVSTFPSQRMDYRPQNLGAVAAVASPPSGANWWSAPGWTSYGAQAVPFNMAPSAWKGALDPNGTTMPIGVQNP